MVTVYVVAKKDLFKVAYTLTVHMTYKNVNDGEQVLINNRFEHSICRGCL